MQIVCQFCLLHMTVAPTVSSVPLFSFLHNPVLKVQYVAKKKLPLQID